jgi:hypothetical protein
MRRPGSLPRFRLRGSWHFIGIDDFNRTGAGPQSDSPFFAGRVHSLIV